MSNNQRPSWFENFTRNFDMSGVDADNPIALFFALPMIPIFIVGATIAFIKQPTADKVGQIAFGCFYLTLAIILSPCACAIWIIQAIAS